MYKTLSIHFVQCCCPRTSAQFLHQQFCMRTEERPLISGTAGEVKNVFLELNHYVFLAQGQIIAMWPLAQERQASPAQLNF